MHLLHPQKCSALISQTISTFHRFAENSVILKQKISMPLTMRKWHTYDAKWLTYDAKWLTYDAKWHTYDA